MRRQRNQHKSQPHARRAESEEAERMNTTFAINTDKLLIRVGRVKRAEKTKVMQLRRVRPQSRHGMLRGTLEELLGVGRAEPGKALETVQRRPSWRSLGCPSKGPDHEASVAVRKGQGKGGRLTAFDATDVRVWELYLALLREGVKRKLEGPRPPRRRGRSVEPENRSQLLDLDESERSLQRRKSMSGRQSDKAIKPIVEDLEQLIQDLQYPKVTIEPMITSEHSKGTAPTAPADTVDHSVPQSEVVEPQGLALIRVLSKVAAEELSSKKHDKHINLSRMDLTELPVEAWLLVPPIQDLNASRNILSKLPSSLERWVELKKLRVDSNNLRTLPEGLQFCTALEEFNASHNHLSSLPGSFSCLTSLKVLALNANDFTEIPKVVSGCKQVSKLSFRSNSLIDASVAGYLPNLETLSLMRNETLKDLPIELGSCPELRTLEFDSETVRFPPETIKDQGVEAILEHLRFLIKAREFGIANLQGLGLKMIGEPLCKEWMLKEVDVANNGLTIIPRQIGGLTSLKVLKASGNHLEELPEEMKGLKCLEHLDLNQNLLTRLTSALGDLTRLTSLDLGNNKLKFLPLSLSSLRNLKVLDLSHNYALQDPPPDVLAGSAQATIRYLGGLSALYSEGRPFNFSGAGLKFFPRMILAPQELESLLQEEEGGAQENVGAKVYEANTSSEETDAEGQLPQSLTSGEDKLVVTVEAGNANEKPSLSSHAVFQPVLHLLLDQNNLRSIPESHKGQYIISGIDHIQGTHHATAPELKSLNFGLLKLGSIKHLSLMENHLVEIPVDVACLTSLESLVLDNNIISTWPPNNEYAVSELRMLTTLSLCLNQLSAVPEQLRELESLKTLRLDTNLLTALPEWFPELSSLTHLSVSDNTLTDVPETFWTLSKLLDLRLSDNQFQVLPLALLRTTTLTRLRLSGNKLTTIPRDIARLKALRELSIGHNRLSELPASVSTMPQLTSVNFSGNNLLSMPPELLDRPLEEIKSYLRQLLVAHKSIDLSGLKLVMVPTVIFLNTSLQELKLKNNLLTDLPPGVKNLVNLHTLNLANNRFQDLPEEILGLSNLSDLDIDNNPLPRLPPEILAQGSMQVVHYLRRIRSSRFDKDLDISKFELTVVPEFALTLSYIQELNLGENKIKTLPEEICWSFPSLTRLNLRNNLLESPLPLKLGSIISLTSLDLAKNQLVALPVSLAQLTRLRFLGYISNPLLLPSASLLMKGIPTFLTVLGSLSAAGVGMSLTQHHPSTFSKVMGDTPVPEPQETTELKSEETGIQVQPAPKPKPKDPAVIPGMDGTTLAPYARPPEYPCVLLQGGKRKGCSIEEAMKLAGEGDVVLLRPGKHRACIAFRKDGVTVGGDGSFEDVELEIGGFDIPSVVICSAASCKLYNMTITYSYATDEGSAILVSSGKLTVVNCFIKSMGGNGVKVRRGGNLEFFANRMEDCRGVSVNLDGYVHAEIRYNDIMSSRGAGIQFIDNSNPMIDGNKIARGKSSAVVSAIRGLGVIKNNELLLNKNAGVEIRSGADPVVEQNKIVQNQVGVLCTESSKGKLIDNIISGSKNAGIFASMQSTLESMGNQINGEDKATGILVIDGSHVDVKNFEIQSLRHSLVISSASRVNLTDCRMFHHKGDTVLVRGEGSSLYAERNEIFGNSYLGIKVLESAYARINENKIYFNGGTGLHVGPDCSGVMQKNEIHDNGAVDVKIEAHERRFTVS